MTKLQRSSASPKRVQLGTFSGVFLPSFLTIMGVIIFHRMGFIVGNGGVIGGLTIVLLANSISMLTSLAVSAIATNFKAQGEAFTTSCGSWAHSKRRATREKHHPHR